MGKTSAEVKNRYNAKAYDRVTVMFPKGRADDVKAYAQRHDGSVNALVNRLVRDELGVSADEWRAKVAEIAPDGQKRPN